MTYEYRVEIVVGIGPIEIQQGAARKLNHYGAYGWECVSVIHQQQPFGTAWNCFLYLKRAVISDESD
ncbi:MAG: hypothetical protein AAGB19_17645 [Cyanobacteria bacterium P01_F01_bin.3]